MIKEYGGISAIDTLLLEENLLHEDIELVLRTRSELLLNINIGGCENNKVMLIITIDIYNFYDVNLDKNQHVK